MFACKEVSIMARTTYGERMAAWEHEQDERFWTRQFNDTVDKEDYDRVELLIKEAIADDYSIPNCTDPIVLKLFQKYGI